MKEFIKRILKLHEVLDWTHAIRYSDVTRNEIEDLIVNGSVTTNITIVNAATYDLLASDYILNITYTSTGAVTSLTLPTDQVINSRMLIIKDAAGNAGTNNITIDTEGSETIDGVATAVINGDYDFIKLYCDGSNWFIIG